MSVRRNRQRAVKTFTIAPIGGLDKSRPDNAIKDSSLSVAFNVWYDPSSGLVTRFGLGQSGLARLNAAIDEMVVFSRIDQEEFLVAASGGYFWRADFLAGAWVRIGNESYPMGQIPQFVVFNQTLLAACGADHLWYWNGTESGWLEGSPAKATCITIIANRVVCDGALNDEEGAEAWLDYVHFSGVFDFEDWDTADGNAMSVAAGFGDGARINGLAVIYDILVVSKVIQDSSGMDIGKRIFGISTAGTPENWAGVALSKVNAALNGNALIGLAGRAMLIDDDGAQMLIPSPGGAYGDIAIDPELGPKINGLIAYLTRNSEATARLWFCRSLGQVWALVSLYGQYKLAVFHVLGGQWTELSFQALHPTCFCEMADRIYIGGTDGSLYVMGNKGTDTSPTGDEIPIFSAVRTKKFEGINDLILKAVRVDIRALRNGAARIDAVEGDGTTSVLLGYIQFEDLNSDRLLVNADDPLDEANYPLVSDGQVRPTAQNDFRPNGPRSRGLYVQIKGEGGRFGLTSILMSLAQVG